MKKRVTLERVYGYEPIPSTLTSRQARHILGAQGNVWTEYMADGAQVEYMAVPRMLALAEVVWSPAAARSWDGFVARLPAQFALLDRLGVNYRLPSVAGLEEDRLVLTDSVPVALTAALADATIRYTLDGSDPTVDSPEYVVPFALAVHDTGVLVTARAFLPLVRATKGAMVFFGSEAALPGARVAGIAAYAAAKGAVLTLVQAIAQEERDNGVRANALAPAAIRTAANIAEMGADAAYVTREAVADVVVWLCSDAARAVTGQVVRVR